MSLYLPTLKHPLQARSGTSDIDVIEQILVDGEADFEVPTAPSLIIDAGANIGVTIALFASKYPSARIVAIEVDPSDFEILSSNAARCPNVTVLKKAVWKETGFVRIQNPNADRWAFQVETCSDSEPDAIPAITIDEIANSFGSGEISLLKMDIEGAEREIFRDSACNWINDTKILAVELHERFRPGCIVAHRDLVGRRPNHRTTAGEYEVTYFA